MVYKDKVMRNKKAPGTRGTTKMLQNQNVWQAVVIFSSTILRQ